MIFPLSTNLTFPIYRNATVRLLELLPMAGSGKSPTQSLHTETVLAGKLSNWP
jgi:hypothetical protein